MAQKKINETTRQNVIKAHENGQSMRKIAKEFSIGLASVHRIIKEKDLPKGQKGGAKKKVNLERQKKIQALEKRIAELENKITNLEFKKR